MNVAGSFGHVVSEPSWTARSSSRGAADGASRRLLVVVTAPDPEDELLDRIGDQAGEDLEVMVVAPVSDLSFLQWLAGEEDAARADAERRARQAAEAEARVGRVVEARVGDPDPLVAIEDALRTFPADEVVIVTRPGEVATWLEKDVFRAGLERLGLPVAHLVDDDAAGAVASYARATGDARTDRHPPEVLEELGREIARGHNPWVVPVAVLVTVATFAALVIVLVFVVAW